MKAKDVLMAIRMKHMRDIVIREVKIRDDYEQAIYRTWYDNIHPGLAHHNNGDRAEVPEGWKHHEAKFERRIDAMLFARGQRTAIEIKVSRADFLRESEEKRRAIRTVTHKFVYAAPKGLIDPAEVPDYAGLWEVDPEIYDPRNYYSHGVKIVKRAKVFDAAPLPEYMLNALLGRTSSYEYAAERVALTNTSAVVSQ